MTQLYWWTAGQWWWVSVGGACAYWEVEWGSLEGVGTVGTRDSGYTNLYIGWNLMELYAPKSTYKTRWNVNKVSSLGVLGQCQFPVFFFLMYYSYITCYHWEKLDEWYIGTLYYFWNSENTGIKEKLSILLIVILSPIDFSYFPVPMRPWATISWKSQQFSHPLPNWHGEGF